MLLLVTVALVLAGLVLLIVGFVQDSLSLIYLSIACAAIAGIALIVFSRLSRRRAVRLAIDGVPAAAAPPSPILTRPRPLTETQPVYGQGEPAREPVAPRGEPAFAEDYLPEEEPVSAVQPAAPAAAVEREPLPAVAPTAAVATAGGGHWEEQGEWQEDWGDEVVFPIEDYDELRVAEILPLLPQLEPDELEDVRDREVNTKSRATIVDRIDELLGGGVEAPAPAPARTRAPATTTKKAATPAKRPAATRAAAGSPAKKAAAAGKAAAAKSPAKAAGAGGTAKKAAAPATPAKATAAGKSAGAKAGAAKAPAKSASGKAAAPSKAAGPSKAAAGKAPAKSASGKAAAAKKVAKTTKAAPTKAATKATQPAKKVAGGAAKQPRKR